MSTPVPESRHPDHGPRRPRRRLGHLIVVLAGLGLLSIGAIPVTAHDSDSPQPANRYNLQGLVSDTGSGGTATDPNLVNGWGLTAGPTTPWWVADNGTDKSTLYTGAGARLGLVVDVPGAPTGAVFNGSPTDFVITGGGVSGVARFIFATESGQIYGWNPTVPGSPIPSTQAFVAASARNAIFKGLAIGSSNGHNYLYATDFHHGRVDVFDSTFTRQHWSDAFVDPRLPRHYAPFGIQNLNGVIFVTYARQDEQRKDETAGEGRGFVSAFGTDGTFLGRVGSRDELDAPWGLAWAPANFGRFSNDLLVGNFGDGRITAFAPTRHGWAERGQLRGADGRKLSIDGLWGIAFGNGAAAGPTNALYVVAGPNDETHGFFGSITAQ